MSHTKIDNITSISIYDSNTKEEVLRIEGADVSLINMIESEETPTGWGKHLSVEDGCKLYKIHADYRKNNPVTNWYYTQAKTKRAARKKFADRYNWLDIYEVEECTQEETKEIMWHPFQHLYF